MNKDEIVAKAKSLNLPKGSYVVFGSCPLAAAGIREANDIDLPVSKEVFIQLRNGGWQELVKSQDDRPLVFDVFEAHKDWNFSSYKPTLKQLLQTAILIEGVPFASIEEVRKWKLSSGRPKDFRDIQLIDMVTIIKENPGIRPSVLNIRLGMAHSSNLRNTLLRHGAAKKERVGSAVHYYAVE